MNKVQQIPFIKTVYEAKADFIGATASGLCMIHCLMTPLIFAVQTTSLTCSDIGPIWWKGVDYLFLVITFTAIFYTSKTTSSSWVPKALYGLWYILTLLIIDQSLHVTGLSHSLMYIPALGLIGLHYYNRRYCQCEDDHCCALH